MAPTLVASWVGSTQYNQYLQVFIPGSAQGVQAGDDVFVVMLSSGSNRQYMPDVPAGYTLVEPSWSPTITDLEIWHKTLTQADGNTFNTSPTVPQNLYAVVFVVRGATDFGEYATVSVSSTAEGQQPITLPSYTATGPALVAWIVHNYNQNFADGDITSQAGTGWTWGDEHKRENRVLQPVTKAVASGATGTASAVLRLGSSWGNANKAFRIVWRSNTAPNAPSLATLVGGEVIDRAAVNRASHSFSDPDPGDSQSAFDHRYRLLGGSWTTAYVASPNTFHDYPAGTFAAGDYERQVRTYDAQGVAGPWSPSGFFTAADAPATPTITDPIQNGTIGSDSADVTWSAPDQDAYQLQVLDGGLVEHDTGTVVTTQRTAYGVPFPDNNVNRSIRVRVRYGGLWSSWYTISVAVSYTRPPTPSVQLQASGTALIVQVVNPAPGAGEPAVVQNDVFVTEDGQEQRRAIATPNGSWTYWLPKAGLDYSGLVRVEAIADNGTRASS